MKNLKKTLPICALAAGLIGLTTGLAGGVSWIVGLAKNDERIEQDGRIAFASGAALTALSAAGVTFHIVTDENEGLAAQNKVQEEKIAILEKRIEKLENKNQEKTL